MSARLSASLKTAELRIAFACAVMRGLYVGRLFLDEAKGGEPGEAPDAIYVAHFNPYDETLLYDVCRDRFLTVSLADWVEAHGGIKPIDDEQESNELP